MLNFSPTERTIIDLLSTNGQMLASTIARKSGIKRPTVYAALNKLKALGLIITLVQNEGSYFKLVDPDAVKDLLTLTAKAEYNSQLYNIEVLTEEIRSNQSSQHEFMSGFEIATVDKSESVYQELAAAFTSSKRVRTFFNPQTVITNEYSKSVILDFLKVAHENGAQIQEIAVDGPMADWYEKQFTNPKHELKRISSDQQVMTDCIIGEEAIYFLRYDDSEGSGIRIQRGDLVTTMQTMFDLLWESL